MTLVPQTFALEPSAGISRITGTATNFPISTSTKITDIFSLEKFNLINFVFILIGLVFFANLIMAGWDYMMSSGDSKKVAAATTRLINGVIGLIMAVAAFVVVRLVTNILGLSDLV